MLLQDIPMTVLKNDILQDFATAYRTSDIKLIAKHLADEIRYDSQLCFETLNRDGYIALMTSRFATRLFEQDELTVIHDPYCYTNPILMLVRNKNKKRYFYRIEADLDSKKVTAIDECLF